MAQLELENLVHGGSGQLSGDRVEVLISQG